MFRNVRSRAFGEQVAEWVENGHTLTALRLVSLPTAAQISMLETAAGAIRLTLEGLPPGLRVTARAPAERKRAPENCRRESNQ